MMRRKDFLSATIGGAVAGFAPPSLRGGGLQELTDRAAFPRTEDEVFLNGAGGTPLGSFVDDAIAQYLEMMRLGRGDGRGAWWGEVFGGVRSRFATLIGADEEEIGLVECTKAGEQIVLEGSYSLLGMASFADVLTPEDVHALQSYFVREQRKLK